MVADAFGADQRAPPTRYTGSAVTTDDRTADPAASLADAGDLRALGAEIASSCAGFHLRRASRAVSQHFDHALAPAGLRMTQFTLLAALALGGPASINEISHALVIDR